VSVIGQEEGIKHGTTAGYKQHRYRKVPACEPCLKAERDSNQGDTKPPVKPTALKTTAPVKPAHEPSPFGVAHGDTSREPALTYIPYRDTQGEAAERRERVKAALTCMLLDVTPSDLIDALGVPDDEIALARQAADRLADGGTE
jgi:hypothetical protein